MENVKLNTIEEAIEDFKAGNFVIVVDDEDRENEGDFINSLIGDDSDEAMEEDDEEEELSEEEQLEKFIEMIRYGHVMILLK